MRTKIANYIRSGHPGLYIISAEETRVEGELKAVANTLKYTLFAWSTTEGMVNTSDGNITQAYDPMEAVMAAGALPENSIVLLRDFHMFLDDGNPVLIRAFKDELGRAKVKGKCLIVLGCRQVLPPELERDVVVLDFRLPDKDQLGDVLDGICQSAALPKPEGDARDRILDAASGLTCTEAENAYALSVIECKRIEPAVVAREKAATIKKNGLMEIVEVKETLSDIGGLDVLKNWLIQRREAFGERARQYRLLSPKGLLLLGVPGTGKSLMAKAAANVLQRPLIRLDMGALMGSLVGESEANLRSAIHVAEAIAPCIGHSLIIASQRCSIFRKPYATPCRYPSFRIRSTSCASGPKGVPGQRHRRRKS